MKLLLILSLVVLCGCREYQGSAKLPDGETFNYNKISIDGCEYLQWLSYGGWPSITHKGNCTNHHHGGSDYYRGLKDGIDISESMYTSALNFALTNR